MKSLAPDHHVIVIGPNTAGVALLIQNENLNAKISVEEAVETTLRNSKVSQLMMLQHMTGNKDGNTETVKDAMTEVQAVMIVVSMTVSMNTTMVAIIEEIDAIVIGEEKIEVLGPNSNFHHSPNQC